MNATREDIVACFRLLLGREPHTEELAGHYLLAGSPLDAVVSSYLQSLEFQHRGLLARNSEAELVTLERFQIYVAADDQLIAPNIRAGYEPETTQSLCRTRPARFLRRRHRRKLRLLFPARLFARSHCLCIRTAAAQPPAALGKPCPESLRQPAYHRGRRL